jgi:ACT domain-containing protein
MRKEASFVSIATAITLVATAASGGMWMGSLAQEVEDIKEDVTKIEKIEEDVTDIKVTQAAMIAQAAAIMREQAQQDKKLDRIIEKLEEQ